MRSLDSRNADEGRSFLSKKGGGNRKGEKLFDERVTIYSDPMNAEISDLTFSGDGRPQQRQQRMVAAENVQRQIAILVIVAVEEAAELMAVQREIRAVQVEDDALGRDELLLHEGVHEEALHGVEVGDGLLVAAGGVGADGGEFETIESAFAGQGLAFVSGPDALLAEGIDPIEARRTRRDVGRAAEAKRLDFRTPAPQSVAPHKVGGKDLNHAGRWTRTPQR